MAKNSNVVLEGVSLADLAQRILEQSDQCSHEYIEGYTEGLCEKLSKQGIIEASDLLRTSVTALENKLSTHPDFILEEVADTLFMRAKIEEISGDSKSRSCEVRKTGTTGPRQRDRSRSRRRNGKSDHQENPGPHRKSLHRNCRPRTHCGESFKNQGRSSRHQEKPNPHSDGPGHDNLQKCKPPLWEAVENNQFSQVVKLIGEGCSIEEKWNGWSPLLKAAEEGYLEILDLLIDNGADLSVTNRNGRDALSFAAAPSGKRKTPLATLRRLLERGADPNHIDGAGMTAKMRASNEGYKDAVACFEEFEKRAR